MLSRDHHSPDEWTHVNAAETRFHPSGSWGAGVDMMVLMGLSAVSFVVCAIFWYAIVAPETLRALWFDAPIGTGENEQPREYTGLRWALGALVVVTGAVSGCAATYLALT